MVSMYALLTCHPLAGHLCAPHADKCHRFVKVYNNYSHLHVCTIAAGLDEIFVTNLLSYPQVDQRVFHYSTLHPQSYPQCWDSSVEKGLDRQSLDILSTAP